MSEPGTKKRFVVSNLGFGYAVQDTGEPAKYEFPAGRDKEHASSNPRNAKILEIFPTRAQAQVLADELNAKQAIKAICRI